MISFDGLNLNDGIYYITQEITQGRGTGSRDVSYTRVASREGVKLLSDEYRERIISLSGIIFAPDITTFTDIVDDFKKTLNGVGKQLMIDDTGRYYVATLRSLMIGDRGADITSADWQAEFVCEIPFALGNLHTATYTITSGITTTSGIITISGTAPARPQIQYNIPDGGLVASRTTTSGIVMYHDTTGNYVTWSGTQTSNPLIYSGSVIFNYNNSSVVVRGVEEDWAGLFSQWDTGDNTWRATFSGTSVGGSLSFSYNPRYY